MVALLVLPRPVMSLQNGAGFNGKAWAYWVYWKGKSGLSATVRAVGKYAIADPIGNLKIQLAPRIRDVNTMIDIYIEEKTSLGKELPPLLLSVLWAQEKGSCDLLISKPKKRVWGYYWSVIDTTKEPFRIGNLRVFCRFFFSYNKYISLYLRRQHIFYFLIAADQKNFYNKGVKWETVL